MSVALGSQTLVAAKYDAPLNQVQADFLNRNQVARSFHGNVFVVEDHWSLCSLCSTPVDPVSRIPVGALYFHPQCLRCAVCGVAAGTRRFIEMNGQPLCPDCDHRGHNPPKLGKSKFASTGAWNTARSLPSRGPVGMIRQRRAGGMTSASRFPLITTSDKNILLVGNDRVDDPSQKAALVLRERAKTHSAQQPKRITYR